MPKCLSENEGDVVCFTVKNPTKTGIFPLKVWPFKVSIFLPQIVAWYSILSYPWPITTSKASYRWYPLTCLHKREFEINLHKLPVHLGTLLPWTLIWILPIYLNDLNDCKIVYLNTKTGVFRCIFTVSGVRCSVCWVLLQNNLPEFKHHPSLKLKSSQPHFLFWEK